MQTAYLKLSPQMENLSLLHTDWFIDQFVSSEQARIQAYARAYTLW